MPVIRLGEYTSYEGNPHASQRGDVAIPSRGVWLVSGQGYLNLFLGVSWFASFCLICEVWFLSWSAWKTTGHSKLLWLGISIVSFFLAAGIPALVWFNIRVNRSVSRADAAHIDRFNNRNKGDAAYLEHMRQKREFEKQQAETHNWT